MAVFLSFIPNVMSHPTFLSKDQASSVTASLNWLCDNAWQSCYCMVDPHNLERSHQKYTESHYLTEQGLIHSEYAHL